jgi:hypothetical protein
MEQTPIESNTALDTKASQRQEKNCHLRPDGHIPMKDCEEEWRLDSKSQNTGRAVGRRKHTRRSIGCACSLK